MPRNSTRRCATVSIGVEALDGPVGPDRGDARSPHDLQPVHEPHRHRAAAAIAPEDVAHEVSVEVAGLDDRPVEWHHAQPPGMQDLVSAHQPDHHRAGAGVAPEDVRRAVAVEIAVPAITQLSGTAPRLALVTTPKPNTSQTTSVPVLLSRQKTFPTRSVAAITHPTHRTAGPGIRSSARSPPRRY